jgi:integrase
MATISLSYNRRNKFSKDGKASIDYRITINRQSTFVASGIKVSPTHFDKKRRLVKKTHRFWLEYNNKLNTQMSLVNQYFVECVVLDREPDVKKVKTLFGKKTVERNGKFISFCRDEIDRRNDLGRETIHHQLNKLDIIEDWAKGDFEFEEINLSFIEDFDNYLSKDRKLKQNTKSKYHALLKSYIRRAVNKKLMRFEDSPYNSFRIRTEETHREQLLQSEVELWENYDIVGKEHLESIIDKFLFSCYTGLRFSDYQNIEKSNFDIISENEVYLTFKMLKVNTSIYRMPLHKLFNGKAIPIFLKYKDRDYSNGKLFPTHTEGYYNRALKTIAKLLEIDKTISSHVGRHTFGTLLATKTNDPMLIKSLMGHKNIDTSMIYINITNKGIEDKLNRIDW